MLKSVYDQPDILLPDEARSSGAGFGDVFRLLRRRRGLIVAITAVGVLAAVAVGLRMPERFATSAVLVFERSDTRLLEAVADFEREQVDLNVIETEMDVLKTRLFVGKVVDELGLIEDPTFNTFLAPSDGLLDLVRAAAARAVGAVSDLIGVDEPEQASDAAAEGAAAGVSETMQRDRAINRLISTMAIDRSSQSLAVEIRIEHHDPIRAAEVANAIGRTYIEWSLALKRRSAETAFEFFRTRSERIEKRIAELENQIARFSEENGLSTDPRDDALRAQILRVNEEVAQVRLERAATRAWLEHVEARRDGDVAAIFTSPLLETLRAQLESLEREAANLAIVHGPRHPARIEAESAVRNMRSAVQVEVDRLVVVRRSEIAVADERLARLEADLDVLDRRRRGRDLAEIRLREMESALAFERRRFEKVLDSLGTLDRQDELLTPSARFLSEAEVPTRPVHPNIPAMVLGAAMGSATIAVILAIAIEGFDGRVRGAERIHVALGAPTLAYVPLIRRRLLKPRRDPFSMIAQRPLSSYAEAMRGLWRALVRRVSDGDSIVVLITSSLPGEGRSAIACGLAATAAAQRRRTALVGFDDARIAREIDLLGDGDLAAVVSGAATLEAAARRSSAAPDIDVFVMARDGRDAVALFADADATALISTLRARYEFVVVDAAPLLASGEADVFAELSDAAVLVARWGVTREDTLQDVATEIRSHRLRLAGVVLAEVDERRHAAGRYGGRPQYARVQAARFGA